MDASATPPTTPVATQYTLTFNANGGSEVVAVTGNESAVIDLSSKTSTKSGNIFSGWYATSDLTGEAVTSITLNGNITVYAKWEAKTQAYYSQHPEEKIPTGFHYLTGTVAFQSGLITGAEWDVMCNFIGWGDICNKDCTNWGNYKNATGQSYTGYHSADCSLTWKSDTITKGTNNNRFIFPTEKFINTTSDSELSTAIKNIYDVAGNVWEWTTEQPKYGSSSNAVFRRGNVNNDGSNYLAVVREDSASATTYCYWNVGLRRVLYVK